MKALIIGASGAIGGAIADRLEQRGDAVTRLSRSSAPAIDLTDDASIEAAAQALADSAPFDRIVLATGILHGPGVRPERSLRDIDGAALALYFRINASGPAVAMRHFLPLLTKQADGGRAPMFAALGARVGSIGDNRLGGWVGYRASKAALHQVVRTLAVELERTNPAAVLVALHPGTVQSPLSQPFVGNVAPERLLTPADSATSLVALMDALGPEASGGRFDWHGEEIEP